MIKALCACLLTLILVGVPLAEAQMPGNQSAEIIQVLDSWVKALNGNDMKLLLDQIAPEAQIDSRAAGGRVSKDRFAASVQSMLKSGNFIKAEHHDRKVEVSDPTHASVLLTSDVITKTGRSSLPVEYKLEKRDGRWLIIELNAK